MAPKNPQAYLRDKSLQSLIDDTATRFVVERGLQNIGEAAFQLRRIGAECISLVPDYERVIATRHILVHGYDEVSPRILWDIVTLHLPQLVAALIRYFEELDETAK